MKPEMSLAASNDAGDVSVPRHIAIIMDGNSRWAKAAGKSSRHGHQKGADALKKLLEDCRGLEVEYLTVYAFSAENWNRSEYEVSYLMDLLRHYLKKEVRQLHENGVRLRFIGDRSRLAKEIRSDMEIAEKLTRQNSALTLTVALSYGGRQEMVRAMQSIAQAVKDGLLLPENIDEQILIQSLDTAGLPDPDLLIRTGGEQRISNFLLWQSAYTEFYFTDTLWPDFSVDHFKEAIASFQQRERRYGARKSS